MQRVCGRRGRASPPLLAYRLDCECCDHRHASGDDGDAAQSSTGRIDSQNSRPLAAVAEAWKQDSRDIAVVDAVMAEVVDQRRSSLVSGQLEMPLALHLDRTDVHLDRVAYYAADLWQEPDS